MLDDREREIIRIHWQRGRLSRWGLHQSSGQSPNGVGNRAGRLIKLGLLRECRAEPSRGGRPQIPLELDPVRRHVTGLLVSQGLVEGCRLNLYGNLIGKVIRREVPRPGKLISSAARLLGQSVDSQTLGIGVAIAGLIDAEAHAILMTSAIPAQRAISIRPVFKAAATRPLVVANDMQALAARWMLTHRAETRSDVLLVGFVDGSMGAAMLIDGRPNRGCVMGCNELVHTRLPVETDRCYCGQTGCLEMICSTAYLRRRGLPRHLTLQSALAGGVRNDVIEPMLGLIANGIANSVNFVRPHRLVLVSHLVRYEGFANSLIRQIRGMLLSELVDRVRIDLWDQPAFRSAETAGWVALAELCTPGWNFAKMA